MHIPFRRPLRTVAGLSVLIGIGTIGLLLNLRSDTNTFLRDLPDDPNAARATFNARVRAHLAPGMPVERVLRQLMQSGFRIDPARSCAIREERRGAVRRVWRIMWDVSGSKVTAIRPTMGVSAL